MDVMFAFRKLVIPATNRQKSISSLFKSSILNTNSSEYFGNKLTNCF